jgi:uncharacterized spore protein YtfJ
MAVHAIEDLPDRLRVIAERVIGTPVERDGATVIPVVSVTAGGGGGGDHDPDAGGSGGGWGVLARPVGAYVISGGSVRFEPAVDVTRVIVGGQVLGLVALLVVRRMVLRRCR